MSRLFRILLTLGVATCFLAILVGMQVQAIEQANKDPLTTGKTAPNPDYIIEIADLEARSKLPPTIRVNGVKLDVAVNVRRTEQDRFIDLTWRLTNVAARSPLIIVKPGLDFPSGLATYVTTYAASRKKEVAYCASFFSPVEWIRTGRPYEGMGTPRIEREWHLHLMSGETSTGTISISVADMKDMFVKVLPKEFDSQLAPELFVEFSHAGVERGNSIDLDAWTGLLIVPPVRVPRIVKW